MKDGRISNPVILEIDLEAIYWNETLYANLNAARYTIKPNIGPTISDFKQIHFQSVKAHKHFDLPEEEQPYFQAEVLVKNFIPLEYIKNIGLFGIPIPSQPKVLQVKNPYTAQITRNTPTAFIFLVDQSVSMKRMTNLYGEEISLAEAVARIVNKQIYDLILRCVKMDDVRHYFDIAVIGYGHEVYSGWNGTLSGRDFVSPEEIKNNPYKKITVREEVRTRKGTQVKEVEKNQWLVAKCDGHWTHVHQAFEKAKQLLDKWMVEHHDKDCYPPTIINITDGQFNHATKEQIVQQANELKSMFTNDGNVLLWNIHITPNGVDQVLLPVGKAELKGDKYSELLYDMSSLLPERYNADIEQKMNINAGKDRHVAMSVNVDTSRLMQLMDIGTPTNISSK